MEMVPAREIESCVCEVVDVKTENPKSMFTLGYELGRVCFTQKGLGLAAPQVGIFRKIMVFRDEEATMMIAINPTYFPKGSRGTYMEACMSYPDRGFRVKRYKSVTAHFWTITSEKKFVFLKKILKGNAAIVYQHETDHLNGITLATKGKEITTS